MGYQVTIFVHRTKLMVVENNHPTSARQAIALTVLDWPQQVGRRQRSAELVELSYVAMVWISFHTPRSKCPAAQGAVLLDLVTSHLSLVGLIVGRSSQGISAWLGFLRSAALPPTKSPPFSTGRGDPHCSVYGAAASGKPATALPPGATGKSPSREGQFP